MRGLLGDGGLLAAALSAATLLIRRTQPADTGALFGILQAFHRCPDCQRDTAHVIHSSVCRTCSDCGHRTYPGDPL
ncbi:hypothetical protein [Kitasatospora kifunensis]|uniref:Uncharacterized protein n=1 Tax=Kitasatospora kifunensis TaxID=58351 RepID=A0A7W7QZ22_KITKI|nr:hypothetical protein [Kitasatospora kifunensis]MBB4922148.1 hypothetical protein [Kitasatospora kifunensis]